VTQPQQDVDEPTGGAGTLTEREVKYRVGGAFVVPPLARGKTRDVIGPARRLDTVYWDTADLRLARRGHTLRHRIADDGSGASWTLKLGGDDDGESILERREVERPGPPDAPPDPLVDALTAVTDERPLVRVAHLRSDQQQYSVEGRDGGRFVGML
jgi:inorganic triphosphatase YgiF